MAVDKSLPANAGNPSVIPGPGRFHRPQSNKGSKLQLLEPVLARARALREEKPLR